MVTHRRPRVSAADCTKTVSELEKERDLFTRWREQTAAIQETDRDVQEIREPLDEEAESRWRGESSRAAADTVAGPALGRALWASGWESRRGRVVNSVGRWSGDLRDVVWAVNRWKVGLIGTGQPWGVLGRVVLLD